MGGAWLWNDGEKLREICVYDTGEDRARAVAANAPSNSEYRFSMDLDFGFRAASVTA